MAKGKRTRWICPDCGSGVMGPRQPRRNNIVRYCLECSGRAGVLIERTAPALQRERERKSASAAAKSAAKRQRERDAERSRYIVGDTDVRPIMRKMCRLPVFGGSKGRLVRRPPELHIRRATYGASIVGRAWPWRNRIQVTVYKDQKSFSRSDEDTLLHELVHIHCGYDPSDTAHWHGAEFHKTFRQAHFEYFGEHAS